MLTKEELQQQAYLVRAWEAACKIEYPTPKELRFRIAVARKLGTAWKLWGKGTIDDETPKP